MSRFGRRVRPLCSVLLCALVGVAIVGCKGKSATPADEDRLPAAQLDLLNQGDRLINEGEDLKTEGEKLNAAGENGADLIKQGEAKIAEGRALKQKAMSMPD